MVKNKPKILVIDYETSPQLGYFWGSIWETNIVEIVEYEQIISASWMWSDEKEVHVKCQADFKSYRAGDFDDEALLKHLLPIFNQADIIVGHNSDQFDMKVFNTRLAFHGLPPLGVDKTFDTKKFSKSLMHLPSNKLNDIAKFFGIGEKYHHSGFDMWLMCKAGAKKAWKEMKTYNAQDVLLTNKIFLKLLPYMKLTGDYSKLDGKRINCANPTCGSLTMVSSKLRRVRNGHRRQYQCVKCGHYYTDPTLIKDEK